MARTPKVVEDRREQIIDAALQVFAHKGFLHATNKDIAQEAGITPGLIYHYFESKDDLLKSILEERSPWRILRDLPPRTLEQSPDVFLRFIVQRAIQVIEEEKFVPLIRLFLSEAVHNSQISSLVAQMMQRVAHFIGEYLAKRMDAGELRRTDPELVAQTLLGSIMGLELRRQILRDPQTLQYTQEQIVETIVTTALLGLLPRSA